MRILIGLAIGLGLFLLGIPVITSIVRQYYFSSFSYQDAILGMLLVVTCVIAAQLTALRPPKDPDRD